MVGWIKLHRKILDNPIFLKPDLYQLFSYCLLRANHCEKKILWNGKEEVLEKGCFITGRKSIAEDLNQNERTTYDRLKFLEKLQMISIKSNNKYSVVKVLNYCIYQGEENDIQQPTNNKPTTNQQPANTDKNYKNLENVEEHIPYAEIVTYLNIETSSKYKSSSAKTRDLIKARWNEGFRIDDFKSVIDKKVASWANTDMDKFLRPETLFGTKFEGYLNEKIIEKSNKGVSQSEINSGDSKPWETDPYIQKLRRSQGK